LTKKKRKTLGGLATLGVGGGGQTTIGWFLFIFIVLLVFLVNAFLILEF
jgi:hypothetical protein